MDFPSWFAFLCASLVTAFLPGQAVLLAIANALEHGRRRALLGSLGNAAGLLLVAGGTLAGLGLALRQHPAFFQALKLCGALYLVYLGVAQWRTAVRARPAAAPADDRDLFLRGVLVALTNPKGILFFAALFPQFVGATDSMGSRFALMTATFVACAVLAHVCFIALAPWAAERLAGGSAAAPARRLGAVFFVVLGLALLWLPAPA